MNAFRTPLRRTAILGLAFCFGASVVAGGDWPQYRGPNRDDISQETGLLQAWPKGGPKLLWTFEETGRGYSGPAIVGQRLYTIGDRGEDCFLIALDLPQSAEEKPREAWALKLGAKFDFEGNAWSTGSSATPTVDDDRVFALSGNGDLVCVTADGREAWRKALPIDMDAEVNPIGGGPKKLGWGFTWSPLVDGERLICLPGGPKGTVAALDKKTGEVLWRCTAATHQAAYASPMLATIDDVRQYVVLTNQGLLGVAADDGKLLWSHPQRWGTEVVNSPIVRGNRIFVTVGAGGGCELIEVTGKSGKFEVTSIYANKKFANHHANIALLDDKLYGNSQGTGWTCFGMDSGEVISSDRAIGSGALTYADGRFYLFLEGDGTTLLLDPSDEKVAEAGRLPLPQDSKARKPNGRFWTPPVVSNGRLYLRDQNLLFCFDVRR